MTNISIQQSYSAEDYIDARYIEFSNGIERKLSILYIDASFFQFEDEF